MDFHETSITGILFDEMIEMRGTNPMQTAHFVKYPDYMLTDFHETSIAGILLINDWNEGCTDDWPPWRTGTHKRPFTQEGNYLVLHLFYLVTLFLDFLDNIRDF